MQVRQIMTRTPEVVPPQMPLSMAAARMRDLNVGVLPVADNRRILGVLTDRDITVRAVASGWDPRRAVAGDVMTPDAVACYEDEDVSVMERKMKERQVRRVLVMDRDQNLVGIVSLGDLAEHDRGVPDQAGDVLREVSRPSEPMR